MDNNHNITPTDMYLLSYCYLKWESLEFEPLWSSHYQIYYNFSN